MENISVIHKLTISSHEATNGTRKILSRKGKRLEVTIPAGVRTGTIVKLNGALWITDNQYGDILIKIKVRSQRRVILATTIVTIALIIVAVSLIDPRDLSETSSENESSLENETSSEQEHLSSSNEPEFFSTLVREDGYIYEHGYIHVGGDYEPIVLFNNPDATNPTYEQLRSFLRKDITDCNEYIEAGPRAYVCGDFAEDVHNNAEAAGIRAAWVAVYFYGDVEGHALNAFSTTDRGLVFIDCVKGDAVAYIEIGQVYGSIDMAFASSTSYSFYTIFCSRKLFSGCYEPMGTVNDVRIYW